MLEYRLEIPQTKENQMLGFENFSFCSADLPGNQGLEHLQDCDLKLKSILKHSIF